MKYLFFLIVLASCTPPDNGLLPGLPPPTVRRPIVIEAHVGEYRDSLDTAIEWWERELGRDMFTIGDQGDFVLTLGRPTFGGTTTFRDNGTVEISLNLGDSHTAYLVIAHELGHGLGLAHDPVGSGSVVAPDSADTDPFSDKPFRNIFLSPGDCDLIAERWQLP